jgi:hypothetical protein
VLEATRDYIKDPSQQHKSTTKLDDRRFELGGETLPGLQKALTGIEQLDSHATPTRADEEAQLTSQLSRIESPSVLFRGMSYPTPYVNGYQLAQRIPAGSVHASPLLSNAQGYGSMFNAGNKKYRLTGEYSAGKDQQYHEDFGIEDNNKRGLTVDELIRIERGAGYTVQAALPHLRARMYETPVTKDKNKFLGYGLIARPDAYAADANTFKADPKSRIAKVLESAFSPVLRPPTKTAQYPDLMDPALTSLLAEMREQYAAAGLTHEEAEQHFYRDLLDEPPAHSPRA